METDDIDGYLVKAQQEYVYSLETGFIDADAHPDASLVPELVVNKTRDTNVHSMLLKELAGCERFDFSVAFVSCEGVEILTEAFSRLADKGVPGRVITTTYLDFNEPDAIAKLRGYPNVEVRVYDGSLHTKGYFFKDGDMRTLVIGSSNLTQTALRTNQEWNLLVRSYENGSVCRASLSEFKRLWGDPHTRKVTDGWLEEYRHRHAAAIARRLPSGGEEVAIEVLGADGRDEVAAPAGPIVPNDMQEKALANLVRLREHGATKALLVSATGTGKTYLAAFDVKAVMPRRALFLVHRKRIADDARHSFQRVIVAERTYGTYSGQTKELDSDYLFCTIQTVAEHLDQFVADEFDYIIIDEAHHAEAPTYKKVMGYFEPRFLLGMTATPMRTTGEDVFALFDNNIAYQITLQDALEADLLSPFHYFGIADLTVDGATVGDDSDFSLLTSRARVDHIVDEIDRHTVRAERRGLMFCSRNEEATELARELLARGIRCIALSGAATGAERDSAIDRLEADRSRRDDWLEYILTVDIFNEGVDIPTVNQIVMLRPTQSAIVFAQQLGRGLRKAPGKRSVLVLDFIGNYRQSYLVPIALSGDRTYKKDTLRRYVKEGNRLITGCSTISFDEIAERRIFHALDTETLGTARRIKQEYDDLKHMLGRIPELVDFEEQKAIDPLLIFGAYGSYHEFLKAKEHDYHVSFTRPQEQMLRFVSQKLAAGKRPHELLLLRELLDCRVAVSEREFGRLVRGVSHTMPIVACSVAGALSGGFFTSASLRDSVFVSFGGGRFEPSARLVSALEDPEFARQLRAVVDFGLGRWRGDYSDTFDGTCLVLNEKYTYEDVCRLLGWDQNVNGQNIGGYKYDAGTNTFPVFINYEKDDSVSDSIRYEDRFLSPKELVAISKQPRHMNSPEIERLRHANETGMRVYLFVRKNKDDRECSKEFYFLGEMHADPQGFREFVMQPANKPAVEIRYVLDTAVKAELYDYITQPLE
jgi:superfamily II DNA or RNA helicase